MNEYALITGGSSGLGYELAKLFANDGINLVLVARNDKGLKKVKDILEKEYNIKVLTYSCDLSVDNSCVKLCDYVDKNNLYIKFLVNNAGIGAFGYFHEYDLKRDLELIDINVRSLTSITKMILPKMINQGEGSILNIASTAAFIGGPKMNVYYASKAYVLSFSEALYEEVRNSGVHVACYCPGAIKTDFQKKSGIKKSKGSESLLMDVETVAKIGYKGLKEKKVIIVPGLKNKIAVFLNKILPRSISRKIVFRLNS